MLTEGEPAPILQRFSMWCSDGIFVKMCFNSPPPPPPTPEHSLLRSAGEGASTPALPRESPPRKPQSPAGLGASLRHAVGKAEVPCLLKPLVVSSAWRVLRSGLAEGLSSRGQASYRA